MNRSRSQHRNVRQRYIEVWAKNSCKACSNLLCALFIVGVRAINRHWLVMVRTPIYLIDTKNSQQLASRACFNLPLPEARGEVHLWLPSMPFMTHQCGKRSILGSQLGCPRIVIRAAYNYHVFLFRFQSFNQELPYCGFHL